MREASDSQYLPNVYAIEDIHYEGAKKKIIITDLLGEDLYGSFEKMKGSITVQ